MIISELWVVCNTNTQAIKNSSYIFMIISEQIVQVVFQEMTL